MTGPTAPGRGTPATDEHETVGAYALGILDDAEATAFEAHLAGCDRCARQLDELAGTEPLLAALADLPGAGTPALGESPSAGPSPRLAEKLADEVSEHRARKRRRSRYLVAAAVALIIGGPLTVLAATGGSDGPAVAAPPARTAFTAMPDKVTATDPTTHVTATVALEKKPWGSDTVLQLKNVPGPEKCALVAVGKNGERETVTSWSVPDWGYGLPGADTDAAKNPLYVRGGAALQPDQIDHFEVMTFSGRKLVQVDA
ncbi:anti-sigma factor family protein [Streptomyces sp. NPDC002514]|uniref:anti-sigma factor family protein n=1 Tax=Streptomyces sp. NPDC001270 TaxID=3364554 RepID=UPI003698E78D